MRTDLSELLDWVQLVFKLQSKSDVSFETQVETPWSLVLKLSVQQQTYYLKQTPPKLYIEPEIIAYISGQVPNSGVPDVLHRNDQLYAFILNDCGSSSLRKRFDGVIQVEPIVQAVKQYADIQYQLQDRGREFSKLKIPNWSLETFPEHYHQLLKSKTVLLEDGLSESCYQKLCTLESEVAHQCALLRQYDIKETLVNCDFNENNILQSSDGALSLIDWGESVVCHPFFTIASFIRNMARRYHLDSADPCLHQILEQYLLRWNKDVSQEEIKACYQHITEMLPIFTALSVSQLEKATHGRSRAYQRWFIADSLKLFLKQQQTTR